MSHTSYQSAEILDLGDARVLTKGSYPHNPETHGNTDKTISLAADLATLGVAELEAN
jgi:hypothetical protein